ncbi:transketolase [Trichoderma novae-zelandiae]
MCAISNGMAAFSPGTFIPITSSFFMFYLYAAPAVRMGALQRLKVIHAATHDTIGMGEDGPTHQPVELASLFRAMPNLLYFRPADGEETAGAWIAAVEAEDASSIISSSRHKVPQLKQTRREGVARGAYVIREDDKAQLTLIGVGAELSHVLNAATVLETKGVRCRVVSFPCQRLFEGQSLEYKRNTLRRHQGIAAVVVEPYAPNGWERYADAGISVRRFGHSLPGAEAYKYFGFDVDGIVSKVLGYLGRLRQDEMLKGEFVDL